MNKPGVEINDFYHYYEKEKGPFVNLSDLDAENADKVMDEIRERGEIFASQRNESYLARRRELEQLARGIFIKKGGKPIRRVPHYMVIEKCDWLKTWYKQGEYVKLPLQSFDLNTVSFSYGDLFPTFSDRVADGKEYRRQVYTYDEILTLIDKYGLPQDWNSDGRHGPERYIEVHVWSDDAIRGYYRK